MERIVWCILALGVVLGSGCADSGVQKGKFMPLDEKNTKTSKSGLKMEDVKVGDGPEAKVLDFVEVHYTGWLTDGKQFDSSVDRGEPLPLVLGASHVIKGWEEGVAGMKEGGKRKLQIPPDLAYGPRGRPGIPENATLVFEIELLKVKPGVKIEDLKVGDGQEAKPRDNIQVHYTGKLANGKQFDSSVGKAPYTFRLGTRKVIAGWDAGLAGMKVGGKRKLTISPEAGYGETGQGNDIPPNSTLIFEVELVKVQ
jgi:FKBP-type peptidyl-prolyl cis-trans isomerase